jgi:hypothetical protein
LIRASEIEAATEAYDHARAAYAKIVDESYDDRAAENEAK